MENEIQQSIITKFIQDLITAARKVSIYPLKHPIVVDSIKNIFSSATEILNKKNTINLSLSPDNKMLFDDNPLTDKRLGSMEDFVQLLKKLGLESLTLNAGITEKEIESFILSISLGSEGIKKIGDINKAFLDKGITHIKVGQFSYIKVDKDKETLLVGQDLSILDKLKAKIKDYAEGKIEKIDNIQTIEKELFELISAEIKENKKIDVATKNLLKKYLTANKEKQRALGVLKDALINYGCPAEEVDKLITKIHEEISREPKPRASAAVKEEAVHLKQENENLKSQLTQIREELVGKTSELEHLKKQNKLIQGEKERIDNIVHHMGEGLVVVDPEGKILLMNSQAENLLGGSGQDVGKPIKELVKDEHLLTLVKHIPRDKEEVVQKDIELFSQNETTKKVIRTSTAVVEDHNGKTVGMVTVLNDITKQRELEQLKSNFVANVSHELRTPLVAIDKSISLILTKATGEVSESQQQFLSIAERNLKRLSLLINDLLDLSKLEAGKMRLDHKPSSIEEIIGDSTESLAIWAKTRSINLNKQVEGEIPLLAVDPNRIIQVLNNLIGNAIKFTPDNGTITVAAHLNKEKQEVEVSVTDTGIGMDKESLSKIFDKFYQVGESTSPDVKGTGIGLSIAKEIVELHGGKIWVDSEKGKGTKFTFALLLKSEKDNSGDGERVAGNADTIANP